MSVEHMSLAFKARHDDLGGPEKLLLLAYTNFTDAHGYCWPGEKRLAHMTGTSLRTVQRAKKELSRLRLIKSERRKHPRTGDPISNLTRVNLPYLATLARGHEDYDDDLIGRISFDTDDAPPPDGDNTPPDTEQDPDLLTRQPDGYPFADDTPPDLLTRQSDGTVPSDWREGAVNLTGGCRQDGGQSFSDPSENSLSHPSRASASQPASDGPAAEDERDHAPEDDTEPGPTDADAIYDAYATAYQAVHQVVPVGHQVHSDAETLLASGWPTGHLIKLATELPAKGYASLARHAEHNPPPKNTNRARLQLPPPCPEHPGPDLPMRMLDTEDGVRRCPLCNPYATDYRGPRVPLPTGERS